MAGRVALVLALTFLVNLPFGAWRATLRKFSASWFVAIHAPVPVVIALRFALGVPFRWLLLPLYVAAYFGGQYAGRTARTRWRARQFSGSAAHPPVSPASRTPPRP